MLKQVYEMKVQILNNNCEVVWSYDIAAPVDQSGDSWTNGKHQIMAGVVFSLRRALEQAEVFPSDPEWKWPFSICPNSVVISSSPNPSTDPYFDSEHDSSIMLLDNI